jgi:uncharacterized protein DUF5678
MMTEDQSRVERWKQAREAIAAAEREADLLGPDPDLLARYAGQWVIIRDGQVIASAPSGRELAKVADIRRYPNAVVLYVPTLEEQGGVHILRASVKEVG